MAVSTSMYTSTCRSFSMLRLDRLPHLEETNKDQYESADIQGAVQQRAGGCIDCGNKILKQCIGQVREAQNQYTDHDQPQADRQLTSDPRAKIQRQKCADHQQYIEDIGKSMRVDHIHENSPSWVKAIISPINQPKEPT